MTRGRKQIGGIRVGCPDVKHSTPTHVPGVPIGNMPGSYGRSPGHLRSGRSTARRSTGINPENRDPIMPEMPNLSPA
jgi:hypothetical protein